MDPWYALKRTWRLIPICTLACAAAVIAGAAPRPQARSLVVKHSSGKNEPRYLLFWRTPEQAADLVKKIGARGDGRTRLLGFGLPCSTFEQEKQVPGLIRTVFATARKNNLAVMLHFDFHVAWQNRPDLWNWFDPTRPGYNPANKANVEWFSWDGPPAKVRYLNWGVPQRIAPPMCYTSRRIRQEWTRLIQKVIAPTLRQEVARLRREGREQLFAGVLVGSEPTFDDYSQPDPVTAQMMAEDNTPKGRLGYRSLMDRGYRKDRPPARIPEALGNVIQESVAFWCRRFVESGIPPTKLYPHVPAQPPIEMMCVPISAAFNRWSRPGWSTYAVMQLEEGFEPLYRELRRRGNPPWGGVEANAGFPGSSVDWETYLSWHYNHGGVIVAVNTGATGTELPDRLEKSAFGPEALTAYRKFLRGDKLLERPLTARTPEARLQHKMREVQAALSASRSAGRDTSPIERMLQERLPSLVQGGKMAEAEALLDETLERLRKGD